MTISTYRMDKTDTVLLVFKKEDYNHRLHQALPRLPISLSLKVVMSWSTSYQWTSLTFDLHTTTMISTSQVFKNLTILRPWTKSLQLHFIGDGESNHFPSPFTSSWIEKTNMFPQPPWFFLLWEFSCLWQGPIRVSALQFPFCTDSLVRKSWRFKSFSMGFSRFKLKTQVTFPSSVNRAFP